MNLILKYGAFSLFSYLIGSIPNGYIITKIKLRKDIRKLGNYKNIGATNVFTSVSPMAGFLTLILDIVKGFIPVFMAKQFHLNQYYILLIGVLAILGHIYPVYIGFKGGTGMATTLGILLGLMPLEMAFVALLWGLGVAIFKRPALMGLIVIVLLPIIVIINHKPNSIVIAALLISIVDLIISTSSVDHIKSMLRGDEYISVKNKFLKHTKKN